MSYLSRWIPQNNISIFLTIQFTTIMASASHIYNGLKCIPMCSLPRLIHCSVCDSINQPPKTTLSDVRVAAQLLLSCHRTPDNSSLYMRVTDMEAPLWVSAYRILQSLPQEPQIQLCISSPLYRNICRLFHLSAWYVWSFLWFCVTIWIQVYAIYLTIVKALI